MRAVVAAGSGFLLAVLWFDLMFDVQVRRFREVDVPNPVLASISTYYRRVTTDARPMNLLVAAVMLATVAVVVAEVIRGLEPAWANWASVLLAGGPVVLARVRTVPNAVRLGRGADSQARQSELARSVLRDHLFCLASISCLLVVQLAA